MAQLDFVGVVMTLLEEVCHNEGGIRGHIYDQVTHSASDHLLLPTGQDVKLSPPSPEPYLPANHHVTSLW